MERVDRYELLGELGRGAMGVVYRARDPQLGRTVALKLLLRLADAEERLRFEREVRAMAQVRHPNLLGIYGAGRDQGRAFLVTDLAAGSLSDELRAGPLRPERAIEVVAAVARGLQRAHEAGVLHRDIKPDNVLLARDGRPLLADFGLARPIAGGDSLTATGSVLGTPSYMAPEQARGEAASPLSDVYGLGALLYACLAGRPPFRAGSVLATLHAVVDQAPPSLRELGVACPPALEATCLRCLAKEPSQRPASAEALAEELERAPAPPSAPSWRAWGALGALGLVALAGGIATAWSEGETAPPGAAPPPGAAASASPGADAAASGSPGAGAAASGSPRAGASPAPVGSDPSGAPAPLPSPEPGDPFAQLEAAMEADDYARARALLSALPDLSDPRAQRYRSALALVDGDFERALEFAQFGLRRAPGDVGLLLARAAALQHQMRLDEAARDAKEACRLEPERASAWGLLSRIERTRARWDEAIAASEAAIQRAPDVPSYRLLRALALFGARQLAPALAEVESLLRAGAGEEGSLRTLRGRILVKLRRPDDAIPDLEAAVRRNPEQSLARLSLAGAYRDTGRAQQAAEQLSWLLRRVPHSFALGAAFMDHGFYDAALRALEAHLIRVPDDLPARTLRARALIELGRVRAARDALLAIPTTSQRPPGWALLLAQACEHYARKLPAGAEREAEFERAARALDERLRVAPRDVQALYRRGRLAEARGQLEAAARDFRAALELAPGSFRASLDLAGTLRQLKRLEDALEAARAATRARPRRVRPRVLQAQLLAELGRVEEARGVLRELEGVRLPAAERAALDEELRRLAR